MQNTGVYLKTPTLHPYNTALAHYGSVQHSFIVGLASQAKD